METSNFLYVCLKSAIRSYPTYEEWKLFFITLIMCYSNRSYPTYEEWKHDFVDDI